MHPCRLLPARLLAMRFFMCFIPRLICECECPSLWLNKGGKVFLGEWIELLVFFWFENLKKILEQRTSIRVPRSLEMRQWTHCLLGSNPQKSWGFLRQTKYFLPCHLFLPGMGLRGKTEAEQLFSQVYLYHFTPSKERLSHPQRSQHGTFNNCIIKINMYGIN